MRASQLFIPTLREDPGDAEAVSHKLLVRGGFIRQVSAGLWSFTPLGWRVHRKIEQIIREEMDAIGGQEMLMPVLTPAELWETTGRLAIPEIFRVKDRTGRDFILPLTHEETVTFHARELQSYRDLPQLWYHFQTKDRDEPRPRGGLLRVREFIMKDAYSFDRDEEGVRASFEANRDAYKKIFARCALETYDVQAESGIMGGKFSIDFLAPSGSGENTLVRCENGDYAGDLEVAEAVPSAAVLPDPLGAPESVELAVVRHVPYALDPLVQTTVRDLSRRRRPARRLEAAAAVEVQVPDRVIDVCEMPTVRGAKIDGVLARVDPHGSAHARGRRAELRDGYGLVLVFWTTTCWNGVVAALTICSRNTVEPSTCDEHEQERDDQALAHVFSSLDGHGPNMARRTDRRKT